MSSCTFMAPARAAVPAHPPVGRSRWQPARTPAAGRGCSLGRRMTCSAIFGAPGAGQGNDPFAAVRAGTPAPFKPTGFLAAAEDRSKLMSEADADTLLKRFDRDFMQSQRAGGAGPATTDCTEPALRAAAIALAAGSSGVMLGICAADAKTGVEALKRWTAGLGLPKGLLHGMDKDGLPVEITGSVFVKYNSVSGDAFISEYGGQYRGVLFTPQLPDGAFRQFGYLPLNIM